ncbi:MAG: (Fe-S)-binding protein [Desulfurivibrionaceae bacterium]
MTDHPSSAKCVKCGACSAVCPVYLVTGRESVTARGKLHLVNTPPDKLSAAYSEIFSQCLLCGACEEVCSRGLKIRDIIAETRARAAGPGRSINLKRLAARRTLASPLLLKGLGNAGKIISGLSEESGLLQKLAFFSPDLPSLPQPDNPAEKLQKHKGEINYFSGCLASYLAPEIKKATVGLAGKAGGYGVRDNTDQTCCGLASYTAGKDKQARKLARLNIEAFEDNSDPILISCASCYAHLKNYPDILAEDPVWKEKARLFSERLREFSSFLNQEMPENLHIQHQDNLRVAIHDPCHLRFGEEKITEAPRRLLRKANSNIILEDIPARCCGNGGIFQINYPELSREIADKRIKDLTDSRLHFLLTTCSGCLIQLNRTIAGSGLSVKTHHLAVFINYLLDDSDFKAPAGTERQNKS